MDLKLEGRRVAVVGGSDGIGRAAASLFLAEGAEVLIVSRDAANLGRAADAAQAETGRRPAVLVADLMQEGSGEALAADVAARWDGLDILVTAVGGSVRADFETLSDADWLRSYEFNILSTVRAVRAAKPLLEAGRDPAVVCLGAAASKMPYPHQVMTNVHKAGLLGLVKTLAAEFAPAGIRVNSVAPGRTRTSLWNRRADALAAERGVEREAVFAEFAEEIPLKRFAEADEIAVMVAWLASPRASYVTGQTINVDGGIARGLL